MHKVDPVELDHRIRAFLAVANRAGVEDVDARIRRAFGPEAQADIGLRRGIEAQLLRWVNTNPAGRHAAAIPAATALHACLFGPGGGVGKATPSVASNVLATSTSTIPSGNASYPATRSLRLVAALVERMGSTLRPSERPRFTLSASTFSPGKGVDVRCPGQVPIFADYRDRLVLLDEHRDHPDLAEKAAKDTYGERHGNLPRIGSVNSEDALTWSFLQTLAARGPSDWATLMLQSGLVRAGNSATQAPDGDASLSLWQRHRPPPSYPGREGATEFDALITLPQDLVSVEAKADSGFSTGTTYAADRHQFVRNIDVASHLATQLGRTYWPLALVPADRTDEIDFVRGFVRDPDVLVRALPHRVPAEMRDIARRIGVATWEDLLEIAGSGSAAAVQQRPLTDLHRSARSGSTQIALVSELLTADVRGMFDAERRCAPRRGDRGKSYLQDHNGIPSTGATTNRGEEHLAIALFNSFGLRSDGLAVGRTGRITLAEYQVPLKARQSDGLGKVDLLGLDEQGHICVIELKVAESNEPPVRAVLEALSYTAILAANLDALVREFAHRGVVARNAVPRVVVWAPEGYWRAHAHGVPHLTPLMAHIMASTGVAISLQSIGDVSVVHGLNGSRPTLLGTPSCREVARAG